MMDIDLADVVSNANERSIWNSIQLDQITLIDRGGNKIQLTQEEIQEWRFIGLSNFDLLLRKAQEADQ